MQTITKTATKSRKAKATAADAPATTPEQAKPDRAAIAAERIEQISAMRQLSATVYNGPSLTVRRGKSKPIAYYLARVSSPVQPASSESERDQSLLRVAYENRDSENTFCPIVCNSDVGALSRCASLGYLAVRGNRILLTADRVIGTGDKAKTVAGGLSRAKAIAAKA